MSIHQPESGAERQEYLKMRNLKIVAFINTIRDFKIIDLKVKMAQIRANSIHAYFGHIAEGCEFDSDAWYTLALKALWNIALECNALEKWIDDFYGDLQTLRRNAWFKSCVSENLCRDQFPCHPGSEEFIDWADVFEQLERELARIRQTIPKTKDELIRTLNKN